MNRWVYWASLAFIAVVVGAPLYTLATDPQASFRDLFKLGIDLEGGTSMIYELRAPEGGEAPDARDAKRVILGRIDPQGTRGYIVRAIGKHRLEIVLPGRQTRVKIEREAVTAVSLAAAREAAAKQSRMTADYLQEKAEAFQAGTRLLVRMKPPLYLDDIQNRLTQALRERKAADRPALAVVGVVAEKEQWAQVAIFVTIPPAEKARVAEWEDIIKTALATQQDVTRVKRLVRQAGFLEFRILADKVKDRDKANFDRLVRLKQAGQQPDVPTFRWYPLKRGYEWYKDGLLDAWSYVYVVDKESQTVEVLVDVGDGQDVSGRDLAKAYGSSQEGDPIVVFALKPQAGARFAKLTNPNNVKRHLAIILDGVVQSAPVLQATLTTGGIIEGYRNNQRERDEVVTILNSGQLAASLGDPITERTVGPELGADNIAKGFQASAYGFLLVVVFMIVYYRVAGCVAVTALMLNLVLTVCIMFIISQTWTLPGIAGLILSLSMAVDANVLIYERLREEKGKEGSLGFALKKSYERAFTTILDSNLTTVIPAAVLVFLGLATEEVKGFCVVLIIGIMVSMFTAVVVTRIIFEFTIGRGWLKQIKMAQLFQVPHIDWMRVVRPATMASVGLVVVGAVLFFGRGDEKYDIEFTGGTQVELALKAPAGQDTVSIETVRERTARALGASAAVQEVTYGSETGDEKIVRFIVSVPAVEDKFKGEAAVKEALLAVFADMRPEAGSVRIAARASEITEEVIRTHLRSLAAPAAAPAGAVAAEKAAAPEVRFIPTEERLYLGKIRVTVETTPALALDEVQRRIDGFIRDRFPDLTGTPYRVLGVTPDVAAGDFKTFDLWVQQPFGGKRAETDNPVLWTDLVKLALGQEQTFASTTSFEPAMAGESWHKAIIAILVSLAIMFLYIWIRFSTLASGLAAVIALVHDVIVTLGAITLGAYLSDTFLGTALLLTDFKVNLPLIGAFLTLVGYSINDKIVILDRIRENRGKYGETTAAVISRSINQTLSRTMLTGVTVLAAVLLLYILGGRTSSIHGLAFVMFFGTIVGTYSSIAIAAPILILKEYIKGRPSGALPPKV